MQLDEAISGRRSVREYTTQPVDETIIRRLIDAAVLAPSAVNEQPWAFTVVRDQALLERISHGAKSYMLDHLPAAHSDRFKPRLSDPEFHVFYHAPALILIAATAPGAWIVEDCGLAAENLMLAAHAAGLGSCWIGFAQGFLNTPAGKSMAGLPEPWVPVAPIIVGHPKAPAAPVPRKAPEIRWIG